MKTTTFLTTITLAAGLLAGSQAFAQPAGGGMGGGMGGAMGMGGMRGGMGGVQLTDDQRTKMQDAMQGLQAQLTPLQEKLTAAQKDALTAATLKNADEKAVRAKVEAVQKIEADIAMARYKAMKPVMDTLTDEQKTQMSERPAGAYNMFLGSGAAGGMGRGMGMGAGGQGGGRGQGMGGAGGGRGGRRGGAGGGAQ